MKCPHCETQKNPTTRFETVRSGWFLGYNTKLIEIFKCSNCGREFLESDLNNAIHSKELREFVKNGGTITYPTYDH